MGGQFGAVAGVDAVYQLLEKPFPGTFAFVSRDLAGRARGPAAAVLPAC